MEKEVKNTALFHNYHYESQACIQWNNNSQKPITQTYTIKKQGIWNIHR